MEWVTIGSIILNIVLAILYDKELADHIKTLNEFRAFIDDEMEYREFLLKVLEKAKTKEE